jgi:ankyrin repeat protein
MLDQVLLAGQFEQAEKLIDQGEKIDSNLAVFKKNQIFEKILKLNNFDLLDKLIAANSIGIDLNEYEQFDGTLFKAISKINDLDQPKLNRTQSMLSKFKNLQATVAGKTVLGFFIEQSVKIELLNILVELGCSVSEKNSSNESYLHQITKKNLINETLILQYAQFLIDQGLDVNEPRLDKKTPLMLAVEERKKNVIDFLLKNNANPNELDQKNQNAFYYAVVNQSNGEIYDLLRNYSQPDLNQSTSAQTSIIFDFLKYLTSVSDPHLKMLKSLIEDGADLYQMNVSNNKNLTALDLALQKKYELLEMLFNTDKINPEHQDEAGNTLLHKLCMLNLGGQANLGVDHYKKVKLAIEKGCDPGIKNDSDQTPLMLMLSDNLKIKSVEFLMQINKN